MPLQCSITQSAGVVATYHVVVNCAVNFTLLGQSSALVSINSYLSSDAFKAGDTPLATICAVDISPLVNAAVVSAPSILSVIEQYLLTTTPWQNATQVA